jgi:hypothetical protein
LKPAQANNSQDPILQKTTTRKRAGRVAQGGGSEFQPQNRQKKGQRKQYGSWQKDLKMLALKTG